MKNASIIEIIVNVCKVYGILWNFCEKKFNLQIPEQSENRYEVNRIR